MDLTYYVFAFYVFLLLCAAIWFYNRVAGSRKAGGAGEEKERQLFKLYQNIEDMLSGFEEYVQESKADIDERFKQAEAVIEKISAAPEQNSAPITASGQTDEIARQPQKPAKSVKRAAKPKAKELMSQYIDQGMDKAEIAKALGKSQREVSLMMEIKKINAPEDKPKKIL